jgi:hypothetical protein
MPDYETQIEKIDILSANTGIELREVFKKREIEMRNEIPDIDTFIVKKFS